MPVLILTGFLCCALVSLALGIALVRALQLDAGRTEACAFAWILGSIANSTLTLVLGLSGAIGSRLFEALAAVALFVLWKQCRWLAALPPTPKSSLALHWRLLLAAAFLAYGILYFRQALAPELSPDAMGYHLAIPNQWLQTGRIYRIADMYAAIPQGVEMLFLFALTIGGYSSAALVHLSFLFVLPVLMLCFARRFHWPPGPSAFAALLVFASPMFGNVGTAAYVDVALAAVTFTALYLFELWRESRGPGTLAACGLVAGYAVAIKYSAAILPLFIAVCVIWIVRKNPRRALPLLTLAIAPLPWFIRNCIWYQDPIAFFGNAIFPNSWFHLSLERSFIVQNAHYYGARLRDLPLGLTIGTTKLPASYGPAFLLMPFCLPGLFWQRTRTITLAALALATACLSAKDPRFIMPAVPLAAMSAGFVLSRVRRTEVLLYAVACAHLVISWPAFMDFARFPRVFQARIHPVTWREALDPRGREEYLSRSNDYRMAKLIDRLVPGREPVLAFTGGAAYAYTSHPLLICWRSAFGERMADLMFSTWHSPHDSRQQLSFAFPSINARRIRVIQTAPGISTMWNVDEIELHSAGKRLAPAPAWQFTASPNPWDVRDAFDGNPATRWRSWDSLRPGMFLAVDFPAPQTLDSVDVVLDNREWTTLDSNDWPARVSLEIVDAAGRRTELSPRPTFDPPTDLRKAATRALNASGIHYLLINRDDWMEQQFRAVPEAWNMHAIAATADATLYRLD